MAHYHQFGVALQSGQILTSFCAAISDPARRARELQPQRDGRVRRCALAVLLLNGLINCLLTYSPQLRFRGDNERQDSDGNITGAEKNQAAEIAAGSIFNGAYQIRAKKAAEIAD